MSVSYQPSPFWFPCVERDRPNDPYIVWHDDGTCIGCHIRALVSQATWPDDPQVERMVRLTEPREEFWLGIVP